MDMDSLNHLSAQQGPPLSSTPNAPSGPMKVKAPKWYLAYFLLAAFDLFTISGSLYLNHTIMGMFSESVSVNGEWANRLGELATLRVLAGETNAPGNDVFDSHDVARESSKLAMALQTFVQKRVNMEQELSRHLPPDKAAPLLKDFQAIQGKVDEMVEETQLIYSFFLANQPERAGERMATMDRKYALVHAAITTVETKFWSTQVALLNTQEKTAVWFQHFEYVIAVFLVLMVGAASLYGHRIYREMTRSAQEKEQYIGALFEEKGRARSVFDYAFDGIVTIDQDGMIESFNNAAQELFGYAEGDVLGHNVSMLVPLPNPNEPDGYLNAYRQTSQSRNIGTSREVLGKKKDGTVFTMDLAVSEVWLGTRRVLTGFARDITLRKQAEASLQVSEKERQLILDNVTALIAFFDLEKRHQFANRMYSDWFSLSLGKIKGKHAREVLGEDAYAVVQPFMEQAIDGQQITFEVLIPHKDGTPRWVEATYVPYFHNEGTVEGFIAMVMDITQRKRDADALLEVQNRLELAITGTNDGLWDWMDVNQDKEWWSPRFYELLEYVPGEIPASLSQFKELLHADDRERTLDAVHQHFSHDHPFDLEYRLLTKSGAYKWFRGRGNSVRDEAGNALRMAGSLQDISERKQLESSIRQYNQDLRKEVELQTAHIRELEQRRMQVEKLAALSQVAAGVAHEINNPLASIKQSFHLVKKLLPAEHPRLKYVGKIDVEINRIAHIIQKMYQLHQPKPTQPHLLDIGMAGVKAVELVQGLQKDKDVFVKL